MSAGLGPEAEADGLPHPRPPHLPLCCLGLMSTGASRLTCSILASSQLLRPPSGLGTAWLLEEATGCLGVRGSLKLWQKSRLSSWNLDSAAQCQAWGPHRTPPHPGQLPLNVPELPTPQPPGCRYPQRGLPSGVLSHTRPSAWNPLPGPRHRLPLPHRSGLISSPVLTAQELLLRHF